MNSSFEQFFKKTNNKKNINSKNHTNTYNTLRKDIKTPYQQKNKNGSVVNNYKYQNQSYNRSVMSNQSIQKNNQGQNSKSNHKRLKRQQNNNSKTKPAVIKKPPTIQLTKKQIQIRQAIQYRFDKSKMKNYRLNFNESQTEQLKIKQIMDLEEQANFQQNYFYLKDLKIINLYDYHRHKDKIIQKNQQIQFKKQKNPNILVIKDTKKRRQNSDTIISYYDKQDDKFNKSSNRKLILNSGNNSNYPNNLNIEIPNHQLNLNYFSTNNAPNIYSHRNYTESSSHHTKNNKQIESPGLYLKLQFPKQINKNQNYMGKPKTANKNKNKNDYNLSLNQKINLNSSSVQKNFKSVKDIYLNAISSLANKNTLKSKNKLFKSDNDLKNKSSKNMLYQSQKKANHKIDYNSIKLQKHQNNNPSTPALFQNYFSCISSRQNKKQKNNSFHQNNRKATKQKLDKTVLINQANPGQWKSIIMKVNNPSKFQNRQSDNASQLKKFKIKFKQETHPSKLNKNALQFAQNKYIAHHPHSQREYTKSPKFKRFIIDQQDYSKKLFKKQDKRQMNSAKNLMNQSYQTIKNQSQMSVFRQSSLNYKKNKK